MGKQEHHAYLEANRRASKAVKGAILNEFCAVCDYHRKYALRLLSAKQKRSRHLMRKPGTVAIGIAIVQWLARIVNLGALVANILG